MGYDNSNNPTFVKVDNVDLKKELKTDFDELSTGINTDIAQFKNQTTAQLAERASNLTSLNPYSKTRYVGHRGLSKFAPEATQPAFELLAEYGLWGAEFDVQVTSDGVWVVYHDDTLDTLTTGTGAIKDYTLSQIKDLIFDAGNFVSKYPNQKILTFDEALNFCRKLNLIPNIEIKSTYTSTQLDSLISSIRKSGMEDKCFILGDKAVCDDIRSRSRKISIMMFATSAELTHLSTLGNSVLNTNHTNITSKDFVDYMHSIGVLVAVFTVNDPALANKLETWGVDFIATDLLLGGIK